MSRRTGRKKRLKDTQTVWEMSESEREFLDYLWKFWMKQLPYGKEKNGNDHVTATGPEGRR